MNRGTEILLVNDDDSYLRIEYLIIIVGKQFHVCSSGQLGSSPLTFRSAVS